MKPESAGFGPIPGKTRGFLADTMLGEGPDRFKGGLNAGNHLSITDASQATSTRDLQELVALTRTGERQYTRCWLNLKNVESST